VGCRQPSMTAFPRVSRIMARSALRSTRRGGDRWLNPARGGGYEQPKGPPRAGARGGRRAPGEVQAMSVPGPSPSSPPRWSGNSRGNSSTPGDPRPGAERKPRARSGVGPPPPPPTPPPAGSWRFPGRKGGRRSSCDRLAGILRPGRTGRAGGKARAQTRVRPT